MEKLGLDSQDFEVKDKEEVASPEISQTYLKYVKEGDPLKKLFTFFNVQIVKSKTGQVRTAPLKDKMDRWLGGFVNAGYDAVQVIDAVKILLQVDRKVVSKIIKDNADKKLKEVKEHINK